jgi:uncharacterized protein DUF2255
MTTWTSDELDRIGTAEELEIPPLRRDGTLRNPVTILDRPPRDYLYVRSYTGRGGAWFQGTQVRHEGHTKASGVEKDASPSWRKGPRHQRPDRRRVPHQVPSLLAQLRPVHDQPESASDDDQARAARDTT